MKEVKELYYKLRNNDEYNEVLVKSFYQFKNDKLSDDEIIDILETWLRNTLDIENINRLTLSSLYYMLRYDILISHDFQW